MENEIKVGDRVITPRFCTVRIAEVFKDGETARKNGFTEPTHFYNSQDIRRFQYDIQGKHTGENLMIFAAIEVNHETG